MTEKYIKKFKTSSSAAKVSQGKASRVSKGAVNPKNSPTLKKRFVGKSRKAFDISGSYPIYKKALPKIRKSLNAKDFFKVRFCKSLINTNRSIVNRKVFTKKINLNRIQGFQTFNGVDRDRVLTYLTDPNSLRSKASIYLLLKNLKALKKTTLGLSVEETSLDKLDQFCLKLEKSGFYVSLIELEKNFNHRLVQAKTKKRFCDAFLSAFIAKKLVIKNPQAASHLISIKSFYQSFRDKSKSCFKGLDKRKVQGLTIRKGFVHLQKNYSYITESRLSLYMATYKKKYKKLYRIMKSHKLKFRRLFFNFQIKQLRHTLRMKKRYKLYRSLTWKRKKKKIRKKVGLFYFLRRRPRMLFRFYIPRHLEINYKTFHLAHLGDFDLPSVNPRISFWLNLRRLLTSLAI